MPSSRPTCRWRSGCSTSMSKSRGRGENALPAVRPVTFACPDGQIVIPTGDNPWFTRFEGTVLAFETGNITASTRTGWSVLTIGRARLFAGTDGLDGFDDPTRSPVERLCRRLLPPHRHRLAQRPPHHPAPPHR